MGDAKSAEQIASDLERVADAIWNAEFLMVMTGPLFDDGVRSPFESDRCDPALVRQPNRFMGFWGGFFNLYNDRSPHEGFAVISRWRDRFFCQDDARKRGKKKNAEEETEFDRMPKFLAYTSLIGNQFQRCGIPSEEVMDASGNITLWQCSRVPPCCQRVTPVERGFRFVIDDATKEAMPVKYISQRVTDKPIQRLMLEDSDEEEVTAMAGGAAKNPFEVKLPREERERRQLRRIQQPRAIHLHPALQAGRDRFPDLFTGYALQPGQRPLPHGFPKPFPQYDEQSPRKVPPFPVNEEGLEIPLTPVYHPAGAVRCSHLLEHVSALDLGTRESMVGEFAPVEPDRFSKDREQAFTALGKLFMVDNHGVLLRRVKYATYNISIVVQKPGSSVLPERLREKLFAVYSKAGKQVPVVNENNEVIGTVPPAQAAVCELQRQVHDRWSQGTRGVYYFSNQSPRQTMQEPIHDTSIDVVHLACPQEGVTAMVLPDDCRISIVCETVIEPSQMPPTTAGGGGSGGASSPSHPSGASASPDGAACPTRFANTWQVVGHFQKHLFQDAEFKNRDVVEYVLIGRDHHGVRIGVHKSEPTKVLYVVVQCPATAALEVADNAVSAAAPTALGSAYVSHVKFTTEKVVPPQALSSASAAAKERPPMPVPNHQLCSNCHDIARPFVLMQKPGDEGFCHGLLAARTKQLKAWEKLMTECLKSDSSKSVVMLELGCDRKTDPAKSYSEKTFKTLKQSKCTFVRISAIDLETKGKKGGEEGNNSIVLVTNPTHALVTIENLLGERLRKGK